MEEGKEWRGLVLPETVNKTMRIIFLRSVAVNLKWVTSYLCGHKSSPDDNRFHVVPRLRFALHYLKDNWSLISFRSLIFMIIVNTVDESISHLCPLEEDVLSLLVVAELHGFIRN